ncbi:hypothetical protein QJS10_CPA06g01655 [Acorus calamus]|uniref:Uncharacterized protein n=1 Tax=Acorus calamus TaxID=4465 RepID=A0AAV9EQA9_ACOCL|nr:hypothetical protein QJS10_CPA06g01655 [Acorus calamus]
MSSTHQPTSTAPRTSSGSAAPPSAPSSSAWSPHAWPPPPPTTQTPHHHHRQPPQPSPAPSSATAAGRVSFCIQDSPSSSSTHLLPLLLEFSVTTAHLAREMESGVLRIALECDRRTSAGLSLFAVPVWTLYFNGRKVGFAAGRHVTEGDWRVLRMMGSVSVGAGVLLPRDGEGEEVMYLRASFDRVVGSADSESFHMINPVGCSGQELSVFFISRS